MPPSDLDIRNRLLVARLPVLPHILLKLIEYCRSEEIGMAELAELISKDPALTTKILGIANSSAYHHNGQNIRLEQSLISLGTDMIRTLVISESVYQTFSSFSTSNSINLCRFWKHSLTAAIMARDIARKMGYVNIDEAYFGGLLHDVGRLAFLAISPNEYARNFNALDDDSLCAVEQRTMQITHAEAGAWLVERWKLDSFLADSVLYHHEPAMRLQTAHPLIRIVYLAHHLASHLHNDPVVEQAGDLCGLKAKDLEVIQKASEDKVKESAEFLGIDLAGAGDVPPTTPPPSPVQKHLKEELHNMVQASEAGRTFARQTNEPELLETITRSARILFHLDDAITLMLNPASKSLIGAQAGENRQRLSGFTVPLANGGAIVESISKKRPTFITVNDSQPAIAEEQLLRIIGSECLVCVPLASNEHCLGVMIGGASSLQIAELRQNSGFLEAFANQAASALYTLRSKQGETRTQTASAIEEFRLSSRKVAHEVNNPLAIIKNYLNLLNNKLAKQEPIGGEISVLHEEIDRVGKIIRQFADPQPAPRAAISDVSRAILDVVRVFRDTGFVPKSIKLVARTEGQPSTAECDEGALKQIFMNLIKNSVEAMSAGGEIIITNNGHINRDGRLYLDLSIKDTGPGIPNEILEKLFTPTPSKIRDGHLGLGLSIVHDLVKKSHGLITCHSSNSGTLFEILLPVRSQTTPASETRSHT